MSWTDSMLFSPLQVGRVKLKNRLVLPPMKTNMDLMGAQARAWYRRRATGGVGLVIVEATPLDLFEEDSFIEGLGSLAQAIHEGGAVAAIQLFHPGRINGERVAVSETNEARAITREEAARIPEKFAHAASVARAAGFEGAEVHGAHDFFLNRFFSSQHNRRRDEYGGSLQNRMRLGLECVTSVRRACPTPFMLLYRHTPVADYPLDDSIFYVQRLEESGLDILDISPSATDDGEIAGLAAAIKAVVSIPVIAVGGMEDPAAAEAVLRERKADLIAIGRSLIADPELPIKVLSGNHDDIVKCTKCNEKCFGNLNARIALGCTQNLQAGIEYQLE